MSNTGPDCCGCLFTDDYGTSTTSGVGTTTDPVIFSQVDPEFERPVSRVFRVGNQSIPNNAETAIVFTDVEFDSDVMWDGGNPTRLTIPIDGFYMMGGNAIWEASDARREFSFRKNGTEDLLRRSVTSQSSSELGASFEYVWFFQPGDYVELTVIHTTGVNILIVGDDSTRILPTFWMMYMGKKV